VLAPGSTIALNDGQALPRLGLGVYEIPAGAPTRRAVRAALDAGYRLIDTASLYGNERDVGVAVRESGLRDEVTVTTKLWNSDHGHDRALAAARESLDRLGLDRIDLYLVHWPVPRLRRESWRALEELQRAGVCRSIGVSNYTIRHLEELLAHASVAPAVNQVELSPFLPQRELCAFCAARGIAVEAYSPLTRGERLRHPTIRAIAARHRRTPAQVMIRWALEQGVVAIPKSARPEGIRENAAVFDFALAPEDGAALDGLDENLHTDWDPTDEP
jgi:diketogulonate reductase-like aldo/keto reductase